jgi:hypothetical protein
MFGRGLLNLNYLLTHKNTENEAICKTPMDRRIVF